MAGGEVQLVDLVKRFGDFTAVAGINLDMPSGEFFSLLGPSGCGKTTSLRMIAGFERPSEGQILLDGVDMAQTPPHKRNVNTVFQNYALFPHLTVEENVAFGLKYKSVSKHEAHERVRNSLELVALTGFEKRRPTQLSGGQQQRVALARALILNPAVLLLDEPLGALDAKLRKRLQIELKALQEEVGITFIYVTHDQEEALTMSDRIAVMSQGRVEQVGPPKEIYEEPATAYVADFLGVSNLMDATAAGQSQGGCAVSIGEFSFVAGQGDEDTRGQAKVTIRPERVGLEAQGATGENRVPGMIERVVYVGSVLQVMVNLAPGQRIQAWMQNEGETLPFASGTPVTAHFPREALRVLPDAGPAVIESGEL
ncbi:MAG: ABC transporter ATP-binding protein [Actinomycetota bacterium]|nr:ABC transporter ATP-binding protein [Actinomycetota bacterium]MDH5223284.1 ABC transporter ATP-binding protein [Actinomycetota bacterium]MDH5313982.1 ABC transporter ATP-binding protein [Actinomycetota bacterium]